MYKVSKIRGAGAIHQLEHEDSIQAKAVTMGILAPGQVLTADATSSGIWVGKGALLRIEIASDTHLAFGGSDIGAVSSSTSPALKLAQGYHLVRATDEYIRADVAFSRMEKIS